MLPYVWVHVCCSLPALLLLACCARPLWSRLHAIKALLLSTLAFLYTTPWDNYIVKHGAWTYPSGSVLMIIGYVPVEEYAFFIIQTLLAVLLVCLVFQSSKPPICFLLASNNIHTSTSWIRYPPLLAMAAVGSWGWSVAKPQTPLFYLSSILWWAVPIIMLQWWLTAPFIVRQYRSAILAIFLPTLLMCSIDIWAISSESWAISSTATTGIMLHPHLPLEEGVFFLLTNIMIVFGYMTVDRILAIMKINGTLSLFLSSGNSQTTGNFKSIFSTVFSATFFNEETELDSTVIYDTQLAYELMHHGSKSFSLASTLFPWDLRHDVTAIYAFCRVTDDIADDEKCPIYVRHEKIMAIWQWLEMIYEDSSKNSIDIKNKSKMNIDISGPLSINQIYHYNPLINNKMTDTYKPHKTKVDALLLPSLDLTPIQQAALRHFRRFASLRVPLTPLLELLCGYLWDLEYDMKPVDSMDELIQYSKCVASTVGIMMTVLMLERSWGWQWHLQQHFHHKPLKINQLFERANDMGIALQLVNIARDLITDARIGRVYAPPELWLDQEVSQTTTHIKNRTEFCQRVVTAYAYMDSHQIQNKPAKDIQINSILCHCACILIKLARKHAQNAELGILDLPVDYQHAIRAALKVYLGIGDELMRQCSNDANSDRQGIYPVRATVPTWRKFMQVGQVLYVNPLVDRFRRGLF